MKTLVLACVAWGVGVVGVRADLTVVQRIEGFGQDMENTARFKDGKTRVDTSPGTSIILDLHSGEMINLMHAPKKYVRVSGTVTRAAIEGMKPGPDGSAHAKPALTATGKTGTISGWAATEYTCTVAGVKTTLWLTTALPNYEAALREMRGAPGESVTSPLLQTDGIDLATLPGFPVRTVLEMQPGHTLTRTVVSVSAQPIADAEFAIPADYHEMAVPVLTPPAAVAEPSARPSR